MRPWKTDALWDKLIGIFIPTVFIINMSCSGPTKSLLGHETSLSGDELLKVLEHGTFGAGGGGVTKGGAGGEGHEGKHACPYGAFPCPGFDEKGTGVLFGQGASLPVLQVRGIGIGQVGPLQVLAFNSVETLDEACPALRELIRMLERLRPEQGAQFLEELQ